MATEPGYSIILTPGATFDGRNYGDGTYGSGLWGQKASDPVFARRYRLVASVSVSGGEYVTVLSDDSVTLVRGDTLPTFIGQIVGDDGQPLDVTGCQVWFNIRPLAGERIEAQSFGCVIVSAISGIIAYDWQGSESLTPGPYAAEVEVIYPSGRRLTVPTGNRLRVNIPDDVQNAV